MDPQRIARVRAEAKQELLALTLRQLREDSGKTQEEIAELAATTQSALSQIERRENNPIEALLSYVEALGGELEVVAALGKKGCSSIWGLTKRGRVMSCGLSGWWGKAERKQAQDAFLSARDPCEVELHLALHVPPLFGCPQRLQQRCEA